MERLLRARGLCLALVGALSLLAHLKGATAPLLDYHFHRQVNTAAIARNYWREARPIHKPRIDWEGPEDRLGGTELPVYMWLYGQLWPVGGLGERWGRLISIAASLATALLLFGLFEREFGREAALFGAALFSVLPIEVYFGRTVQPEATALLALVASLVLWERHLAPGRPWGPWLGATLCAFVAVGLKLPYAHVFAPLAGLAWRRLGRKSVFDARMLLAGFVAVGAVLAWYLWARSGVYVVPTKKGDYLTLLELERIPYFVQFLLLSRLPELVLTYGGLALFAVGAREALKRRKDPFWLAWTLGTLFHLVAIAGYAHAHEYTALPFAPVAAGLMGLGVSRLLAKARAAAPARRSWALAGVGLLVAVVPIHAALRIPHWYRQGFHYLAGAGRAADAVSLREDLFVTNVQASSVLLYYLDRRGWGHEFDRTPTELVYLIDRYKERGAKFMASEKRGLFAEPDGALWRRFRKAGPPAWDDGRLVIFRL